MQTNYIYILDSTRGFNELGKDNCTTRWESFKFCDLVHLVLEILRYVYFIKCGNDKFENKQRFTRQLMQIKGLCLGWVRDEPFETKLATTEDSP